MDGYLLGIDIGTASTKAVLATPDGRIVAQAHRAHGMDLPRPGWVEVDAEQVWWGDVVSLARELTGRAPGPIAGVCVSGVGPCLLLCDEKLQPVRPAILYGIDSRASAEIAELNARHGPERLLEHCGKALSSQAVGPKLLWARRHEPVAWERAAGWYSSHSFAVARLTGEYVLDHHTASQCDPLYDLRANDWSADFLAELTPDLPAPRLAWPGEVVGQVHAAAAEETGLPVGTPVCAGTIDAWAEAFSAGVRRPGDLMLMYGSTMFFVQVLESYRAHPTLWTTAGTEAGRYTLAAGMATSGSLTAWVRDLTGGAPFETLVAEAAEVPPGSDGLLVLPYFAGERSPLLDPQARGLIAGLTLRHGRGHLYRAVYEGIAYGIRQILELLDAGGGPASRIVAVGGGTRGGLWPQIVSDVTGRTQLLPAETIGASYGGALLAAVGTGLVPPDTDWATGHVELTPRPANGPRYEPLYRTYTELYPAVKRQMHTLAHYQETYAR
ncbi:FGGY-family carbohydrate kinase [Cryptosporangium sp. NPDC051539]|uniref:FGGY-family carbohydrate kinase n=1 Tax=Cryptosporangium sp. NPDC051539 TaxID=3363962 RepID=UPI003788890C